MPTYRVKVDDGCRIELPAELRERLRIAPGSEVEFFLTLDGEVLFHAITGEAQSWQGLKAEMRTPPISIREMDEGIADHLADDDERMRMQGRGPKKASAAGL